MRILRIAVLGAALAALLALTGRVLEATRAPADPGERKIASSKRFLYYTVTPEQGPSFRLGGGERELHIVSHAVLPGAPPYDPARQVVYGLELTLEADGKEVWKRELYTRSRQSKARREGGLWLDEAAFSLERGLQVTDDRLIVARLPEDAREGETLRLRLRGEPRLALVRVYDRAPRQAARVQLKLRSLSPADREELAEDLSYTPWDRLNTVERTARLRFQRLRMPALGHEGEGYETRALYVSDFRLPRDIEDDALPLGAILVTPARAAALNVVGPVELELDVARGPTLVPSLVPATLQVVSVGDGGQPPVQTIAVPPSPTTAVQQLLVPPGLHSLQLATDAQEGVRVTLTAPPAADAQLGVPHTPGVEETLAPQEVLLPGHILDAASPPLIVTLAGPDDLLSRVVRVDARLLPAPAPPGSAVAGDVTVDMIDQGGRRLSRQPVRLSSVVSSFEEVRSVGSTRLVAEPASFRLIAPAAARRVEIRAAQPTFVRAHALVTLTPDPDTLSPPFDAVQLVSSVWRYAPFDERSWIPVLPANRAELAAGEARLLAQVRLEPAPALEIVPGAQAQSLVPEGAVERQIVLEREDAWGDSHQTLLRPGRAQKVRVAGPVRVGVSVTGSPEMNLGKEVRVDVDGARVAATPVAATRMTVPLPPIDDGVHTITVSSDAPQLRLLVDQAPAGGGEIVAMRGVYRLAGSLRLRANKPAGRPSSVNLVIYAPPRDGDPDLRFKVTVDGGNPRRVEGVALAQLTPGARTVTLPPADRPPILGFADLATRTVYHPRLVSVTLGDDVSAGGHTITIQPLGRGRDLWMRAFIMTTSKIQPDRAIQWRLLPRGEGNPDD